MKSRLIVIVLISLLSINGKKHKGVVIDRPLVWKDFKGKVPRKSPWKAYCSSLIGYETNGRSFKVNFWFDPKTSWVNMPYIKKLDKEKSAYILKHEQGHYDISRIISWELEVALNSFEYSERMKRYQSDSIYRSFLRKGKKLQVKYDNETNHSVKEEEQLRWNGIIEKALTEKTINL